MAGSPTASSMTTTPGACAARAWSTDSLPAAQRPDRADRQVRRRHRRLRLAVGEQEFALTLRDVDALQRAKAAIGAGIAALGATAGVPLGALRRIVVAGLFGRYLDIGNAQAIGLLPPLAADRIELAGNTAAAGMRRVAHLPAGAGDGRTPAPLGKAGQSCPLPGFRRCFHRPPVPPSDAGGLKP